MNMRRLIYKNPKKPSILLGSKTGALPCKIALSAFTFVNECSTDLTMPHKNQVFLKQRSS